jgi:hypothetical protein
MLRYAASMAFENLCSRVHTKMLGGKTGSDNSSSCSSGDGVSNGSGLSTALDGNDRAKQWHHVRVRIADVNGSGEVGAAAFCTSILLWCSLSFLLGSPAALPLSIVASVAVSSSLELLAVKGCSSTRSTYHCSKALSLPHDSVEEVANARSFCIPQQRLDEECAPSGEPSVIHNTGPEKPQESQRALLQLGGPS